MTALATEYNCDFSAYMTRFKGLVDCALADLLDRSRTCADDLVYESMRHSLLSGGKRIRGVLTLAVAELLDSESATALPAACAVEIVHCASLILDDLPCMDDARLRRGQPANHILFGDDVAILAAINLLNLAYRSILDYRSVLRPMPPDIIFRLLDAFNRTVGSDGLIGGQIGDLHPERLPDGFGIIRTIYERKTVRLFMYAAEAGALVAGATEPQLDAIVRYARHLGLAFQVYDDLLDLHGDPEILGKDVLKDGGKRTLLKVTDPETTARMASELIRFAARQLQPFGDRAEMLVQLPRLVLAGNRLELPD
jgi:geranylgeranyl pyrophosphate synthase